MRSIIKLAALCLLTIFTLVSCASSSNTRNVAADEESSVEYRPGKRLINETNY